MKLVFPFPPSVNKLYRTVIKGFQAMVIKSSIYRAYEGLIRRLTVDTLKQPYPKGTTVAVTLHFYRPQKRGDLDNMLKAMLDVLHGIAFEDDQQVIEIHAYRHDDKISPRASVEVWDVDEQMETNLVEYDATRWQEDEASAVISKALKGAPFDDGVVG